ncbi:ATP synthase F1 subunit gamma [Calditerrivibrio nitroreducens]|uniref:ATP synthase gamma chain n=1 Tax=Calditerrivibrio nitroreducens (strain DSM 19672 / NBRC 101217 / Yu37-1) TaxID=768670 RepID=E4TF56_CALNY|nr:ATP synthase F1 subunit gamma [Calditerrivibrio nitroreducens]ADR19496.1 ATP synthase F1 subcomplex gamma subunit [Calditerrivibrio nitroreducens DSM 19672]
MPGMRDIKRKINSVKNTQKITKAMKMVSAAKMRKAQDAMNAAKPYARKLTELVNSIGSRVSKEMHPFLQSKEEVKSIGVIVVSSDRGLCGAFNNNIIKTFSNFVRQHSDKQIKVITVGRKIDEFARKRKYNILDSYVTFGGRVRYDDAVAIGEKVNEYFISDEIDELYLIYNEFKSIVYQTPKVIKLLPVSLEESSEVDVVDYLFEPNPASLIKEILPKFLNFNIFSVLLESTAGEHGARMAAMDNATRNAGEFIRKLTLTYNKARQAAITKEILDIVNGAEALK